MLRDKIIEHMKKTREWGQFFPKEHSCFSYNESTAHESTGKEGGILLAG